MSLSRRGLFAVAVLLACRTLAVAGLTYEGSVPIGENILQESAETLTARTGVAFDRVTLSGSSAGYKAVMEGKCDVGGVARALTAAEKQQRPYYQIVGYDAVAVFVNAGNPVRKLTSEQLKKIFTGKITNWEQVGGSDAPILIYSAPVALKRATFEEFKSRILDGQEFCKTSEIDNPTQMIQKVADTKNAITFESFSYARPGVEAIAVNDAELTPRNIRSGAYLLSRPLILVARKLPEGELRKFFHFIISPEGQAEVGKSFIPVK